MRKVVFCLFILGAHSWGLAHSAFVKLPPKEGVHKRISEDSVKLFRYDGALWLKLESASLQCFSRGILEGDEEQESGFESALSSLSIKTQHGAIRSYHHMYRTAFHANTYRYKLKNVGAYLYRILDMEDMPPALNRCTLLLLEAPRILPTKSVSSLFRSSDLPLMLECPRE